MELGLFYEFCPLLSQVSNSSPLQTHYPTSVMVAASCCVEASLQQLLKVEGKLNAAKLLRNPEGNPLQSESHTFSTQ